LEELGRVLQEEPIDSIAAGIESDHLSDDLLVDYCANTLDGATFASAQRHLDECTACSEEVSRLRQLAEFWRDEPAVAALEQRVRAVVWPMETSAASGGRAMPETAGAIGRMWDSAVNALTSPFAVSLKSMIVPQGAYGETKQKEEETATLEFFVTQEGKIVEGLRGLLKRVNREYYVRIFAVDPGARSRYGDRKAVISISDTYQERPILHRKIDIGVTVLLGTDFRLTDNSCLAVEMLPSN
jgi:hypothetical protein